ALKNIEIIERENLLQHVNDVGQYFEDQLHTLVDLDIVGEVRGKKFMMCIENLANKKTKELFPSSVNVGSRIADYCQKDGLIIRPVGHMNIMSPPLILNKQHVDFIITTLRKAILSTTDDLKREGYLSS
ncbi:aminotransferase class III-fold pyridoxal phosphate-dependent enzyme, partial [Acinetobacter sp.]